MAHAAFHFAAGLVVGMALQAPATRRAWKENRPLAPAMRRWLVTSWGTGLWAIIPSLLRYAGMPESFCNGWWMNLFLLHPLINRWSHHATIIGGSGLVACLVLQYIVILAAIKYKRDNSVTSMLS